MKKQTLSGDHLIAAVEQHLKTLSLMDDNELLVDIKPLRNNNYEITTERINS